ncbi:DedA family protein [Candidatus Uhrbacteria bacterium]|nr:DedA family protein [Candidatus Uhrbacteria bacterium]
MHSAHAIVEGTQFFQHIPALVFVAHMITRYGAIVIFIISFIEVIPPVSFVSPGIFVLVIAGTLAPTPEIFLLFVAAASAGVVLGNMVLFRIGHTYGRGIAHFFHLTDARLDRVELFMKRFGRFDVFLGQFVGIVRPGIAFIAGTTRMSVNVYYPWMVASSIVWAIFYLSVGAVLHTQIGLGLTFLRQFGVLLYALIGAAILVQIFLMHRRRKNPSDT